MARAIIAPMLGTIESLALAVACFVGGHVILSSVNVRARAAGLLGETGFRAFYALMAGATFAWTLMAYKAAPAIDLWIVAAPLKLAPYVAMPFASLLFVAGMTSRTVTMVGGEGMAGEPRAVSGVTTVCRHPFLAGVALWAFAHIAANGEAADLLLFGGMATLSLGGMAHIDHRRSVAMGADWGPVAMTTSIVPFLAAIQGRRAVDWRGIGWARLAGGVALLISLPFYHDWVIGIPILPDFLDNLIR